MRGAVLVAVAAAIGNMLQGWDNATIAGSVLYIKKEFNLQTEPTIEGLIVAMSLIGATIITTFSGPVSDSVGRRPMLIASSILYFISGLVMLWAPNVYTLLLARLLDGFGIGLAVTLVPVYISETAPPEIRGLLNTLPQFTGCAGMFLSYCMVFTLSLTDSPSWRLMLGVLFVPSLAYFVLTIFFLPESPRWLVSKGRMEEAKMVLQRLRGMEDVSGEMALLVEGLGVGGETSIEEYIISPTDELNDNNQDNVTEKEQIKFYGAEDGHSWVARPAPGQSSLAIASRQGSILQRGSSLIDPMVTLFGSVHEKLPGTGSMIFPTFGSMFNVAIQDRNDPLDEENQVENQNSEDVDSESDDNTNNNNNLRYPLLSNHEPNADKETIQTRHGSSLLLMGNSGETASGMDIGGGWQMAYIKSEERKKDGVKRIYLHQENGPVSRRGSLFSLAGGEISTEGETIHHTSALVSQSVLRLGNSNNNIPPEAVVKSSTWVALCEPGVKHALVVGVGLQILQQFSGINGVLYYTPQILEQAGVGVLLANLGLGSDSASLLISGLTTFLMLPSIGIAMRLVDVAGRRWLLLTTIPVLLVSLMVLVFGSIVDLGSVAHAVFSTISVVVYFCFFVMGFGPIPNILCSEIFPTRVRGICIAICALTFWICDIIVTYSLPVMLNSIGLGGVFGMYAIVCTIAWFFIFLKVPETKGMPLEVITEFFALGAKQNSDDMD